VTSFRVDLLAEYEWRRLRNIRLTALSADPTAFLASYETEAAYEEGQWRRQFSRGDWNVMAWGAKDVGLVGVTREPAMSSQECYLEYLWVTPGFRERGVASMLLSAVLDRLRDSGVLTAWLWILDGNDGAMRLYQRFGFQSTNERLPLPHNPARTEERMRLRLC
jgi:ribosomal protein S18 acetylase RimI-like enzyme